MDRVARGLARLLEDLLGYVFLVITLAVVVLVVLRYFFLTTIVGGQEFTLFCFIYTSAIGAAVLLYKGEHIAIPAARGPLSAAGPALDATDQLPRGGAPERVGGHPEHSLDPVRSASFPRPSSESRRGWCS